MGLVQFNKFGKAPNIAYAFFGVINSKLDIKNAFVLNCFIYFCLAYSKSSVKTAFSHF